MTMKRTRIGEIGRAFKERGGKYEMRINYLRDIEDDAEDIDTRLERKESPSHKAASIRRRGEKMTESGERTEFSRICLGCGVAISRC